MFKPIIFVNNPIENSREDIVGFDTQVQTIKSAIDEGATMIGIIANYGTGKTSVTDILSDDIVKDPYKFPKPITINMWDCLQSKNNNYQKESLISNEISDLTKSFLFQLANGKNRKLSSYINKRLSKNYGIISFSLNSIWSWILLALAIFLFALSEIPSPESIYFTVNTSKKLIETLLLIHNFSSVFLSLSIAFAIIGVSLSCIAFSHWKMEKKSGNEVNDIFDTYEYIINRIKPICKSKKRLIIIEDLDRISDKSVIIGFLKELYRFQTSLEKFKHKFVFIISIKPETMLHEVEGKKFEFDDDKIYSKIFDAIISLKPIHFDDYDSVLIHLLNSNENKKRELERLIGCDTIKNVLPDSFNWIKKGTNLTIRDLKERLNNALGIMVSLKNKEYDVKSASNFNACAAVAYLEHQYPNEYGLLINDEKALSNLIRASYRIKNRYAKACTADDIESIIKNGIDYSCFFDCEGKGIYKSDSSEKFVKDLCDLILNGIFDEDFRMYFYTYPKGSHIKTTDEKYLCNLLQLPHNSIDEDELSNAVNVVYKDNDNNIVTNTIKQLVSYPDVVLFNDKLLEISLKFSSEKTFDSFLKFLLSNSESDCIIIPVLQRAKNLGFHFELIDNVSARLIELNKENLFLQLRKNIIQAFDSEIVQFKKLFFGYTVITEEEIQLINNPCLSATLIDSKRVSEDNFKCFSNVLTQVNFKENNKKAFENSNCIFEKYCDIIKPEILVRQLLRFMKINNYLNEKYLIIAIKEIGSSLTCDEVARFINKIKHDELSRSNCLPLIDSVGFTSTLSLRTIKLLIEAKLFYTPLLYCSNNNTLRRINFESNADQIIQEMKKIIDVSIQAFFDIRRYILENKMYQRFIRLFSGEFPAITNEELTLICDNLSTQV